MNSFAWASEASFAWASEASPSLMEELLKLLKNAGSRWRKSYHAIELADSHLRSAERSPNTGKSIHYIFLSENKSEKNLSERIEKVLKFANIQHENIVKIYNNMGAFAVSITPSQSEILNNYFDIKSVEADRILEYDPPIEIKAKENKFKFKEK